MRFKIKGFLALVIIGCGNHANEKEGCTQYKLNVVTDTVDNIEPVFEMTDKIDSIIKDTSESNPKEPIIKEILIEEPDEVPIDDYISDPMDKPGYIGTPCEFDSEGNCIEHPHKND